MDETKKDKKAQNNTKIMRPRLIRRYTDRKSKSIPSSNSTSTKKFISQSDPLTLLQTSSLSTLSSTSTLTSTLTSISTLQSHYDINPIGQLCITLIDKFNEKSYMSFGSNNEIYIDLMSNNLIHTSMPAFTEYIIGIINIDPSVDVFYTLEAGRVNDRDIVIDHNNNLKIQCFDKLKLKGYRLHPKNPNGSAFLSYRNSNDSSNSIPIPKHKQSIHDKHNAHDSHNTDHDFSHDNMIELIFKKWLIIPSSIHKVNTNENINTDMNILDTPNASESKSTLISEDIKGILIFRIKINCNNPKN